MSTSETEPLNPTALEEADPELNPYSDDALDILDPDNPHRKKRRDPLYILIIYGISLIVSTGGIGSAIWGYCIVITAPFDKYGKRMELDSYRYFWGMQSVLILLSVNILWSGMNFYLAFKGRQSTAVLFLLNPIYDFFLWALLIAFGVLNMVEMLWDRRLCDGLAPDKELYRKCDEAMLRLLVVEMVAVNLGLLVAVLHFILMIARCCTCGPVVRSLQLRERIAEEEHVLLILRERRTRLIEENAELEARRKASDKPLPSVPVEDVDFDEGRVHNERQEGEEDLIDMTTNEQGRIIKDPIDGGQ